MRCERGVSLCSPQAIRGLLRTGPLRDSTGISNCSSIQLFWIWALSSSVRPATSSVGWALSKITPPECFLFFKRTRGGHVTPHGIGGAISSPDGRNDGCSRSDSALGSLGARVPPPEVPSGSDFRHNPARPKARSIDVGDRVLREATLLIVGVEDRRAVAHAYIVTLTIAGRRVVYLEKEFQQISETGLVGIEHDLDRFVLRAVIPIGGVLDVTARIAHPGGHYAREPRM